MIHPAIESSLWLIPWLINAIMLFGMGALTISR